MKFEKNSKKIMGSIAGIAAVAMLLSGTFAYFTDRELGKFETTAGTLDIEVKNDIDFLDEDGKALFYPGEARSLDLTVTNKGSLSADIRRTIILQFNVADDITVDNINKSDVAFGPKFTYPFRIFKVEESNGHSFENSKVEGATYKGYNDSYSTESGVGNYTSISATNVSITGEPGNKIATITYVLNNNDVVNGFDEDGDEYQSEDGVVSNESTAEYSLAFESNAGNKWQGTTLNVSIITEAKQHRDTDSNWTKIASEDYEYSTGSTIKTVPDLEAN